MENFNSKLKAAFLARLKTIGLKGELSEKAWYFVENKHPRRFEEIVQWLRSKRIDICSETISIAYQLDVVIRRKLGEILKPLELETSAKLTYFIEANEFSTDDYHFRKMFENHLEIDDVKVVKGKNNTFSWLDNSISSISKKIKATSKKVNLSNIIYEMSFGQMVAFLSLMKESDLQQIYGECFKSKAEFIDVLENIVVLRNLIAHHDIILTTNKVKSKNNLDLPIEKLISSVAKIARGNYLSELSKAIDDYQKNKIAKVKKTENIAEDEIVCQISYIDIIFDSAKKTLIPKK